MHPLNQALREMFHFNSRDLLANRAGQLSARQQARQQALSTNLMVGIGFAVAVLLGSLVVFGYGSLVSGSAAPAGSSDNLVSGIILGGVILLVVIVTILGGLQQVRKARSTQIVKAEGTARRGKTRADAGHFEIKIGESPIRLISEYHRAAFEAGTNYRVFYLPAAIPTILSAEVIGTEAEAHETLAPGMPIEQDEILQMQRNARRVVIVLAALVLGTPMALFIAPPGTQLFVGLGLLVIFFIFLRWALRSTGNDDPD